MNPYEILGVATDATDAEIRRAFRKLASKFHPDRADNESEALILTQRMAELNQANDILSDSVRRKRFDETGKVDELPTIDQQAAVCAMNMLREGVMACAKTGNTDIVYLARQALAAKRDEGSTMQASFEEQRERLRKGQAKLKPKKDIKQDLASMILTEALADLTQRIDSLAEAGAIFSKARELLDQYERNPMESSLMRQGGSDSGDIPFFVGVRRW